MTATPMLGIQTAMFTRLTGDGTLMAMVNGIYDEVPEGTIPPYVVVGEALETPRNAHDGFGRETVHTLHIWSNHAGMSESLAITNRILALFDHKPLTITGQNVVAVRYEFAQTLRDPDPKLRHVLLRFRVTTEQQ